MLITSSHAAALALAGMPVTRTNANAVAVILMFSLSSNKLLARNRFVDSTVDSIRRERCEGVSRSERVTVQPRRKGTLL